MSNALNRNLTPGEVVVLSQQYFTGIVPLSYRAFVCEGGFGMKSYTSGHKIYGRWEDGTGQDVILGDLIDPEETAAYQAQQQTPSASKEKHDA